MINEKRTCEYCGKTLAHELLMCPACRRAFDAGVKHGIKLEEFKHNGEARE